MEEGKGLYLSNESGVDVASNSHGIFILFFNRGQGGKEKKKKKKEKKKKDIRIWERFNIK